MNVKALLGDFGVAALSQGISLLISLVTAFLLPKVLGVEAYAYWQLFIFYASYSGFCHLGLNDGVYLIHGGESRDEVDKSLISSQFRLGIVIELVLGAVVAIVAVAGGFGEQRTFVLLVDAAYIVIYCATGYLGFVFQMMNETRLFSFSIMVDRLVFSIPLVALLAMRVVAFEPYVIAYFLAKACALAYCVHKGRDLVFTRGLGLPATLRAGFQSIRVGVCLMLSNIASQLILGVARMAIDAAWGIEAFGQLSFALSIVGFIQVFVSQLSMVLFPALRQGDKGLHREFFVASRDMLASLLPLLLLLYFPVVGILGAWLPEFGQSLEAFRVLLPLCMFDMQMDIVGTTFFKVLRAEKRLLALNAAIVAGSIVGTLLGIYVFDSVWFVLGSMFCVIALRSVLGQLMVARSLGAEASWIWVGELVVCVGFFASCRLLPSMWPMLVTVVLSAAHLAVNRGALARSVVTLRGL